MPGCRLHLRAVAARSGPASASVVGRVEAHETPEARFANAMDRLQPLLNNYFTKGSTWKEVGVTQEQVITINQPIGLSSPQLWAYAQELINDAVRQGFLHPANTDPATRGRQGYRNQWSVLISADSNSMRLPHGSCA